MAGAAQVVRREIRVDGIVQGVGFRPRVFGLASAHGLMGWVLNCEQGVIIEVEGPSESVAAFQQELVAYPPPLAVISRVDACDLPPAGYTAFEIAPSRNGDSRSTGVPADSAICPDCRQEILNPQDRRNGYAFTNCTNCGPRFTIVKDIPYDRPQTTMAGFPMCPACNKEYHDPLDRRFHAQPNACPVCGPQARVVDREGRAVGDHEHWAAMAADMLRWGMVLAVKGLGGFHLACDAANPEAVAKLRERKRRPDRPLAVMVRDLEIARRICWVNEAEERLLTAPAAPIVLLERRKGWKVADEVAPGLDTLGVMLPYTPLHVLLMEQAPPVLVMTSGNPTGLPLCIDNEEAMARLGHIADGFVLHNRPIHVPCDDSVVQVVDEEPLYLRRSRGHVPRVTKVADEPGPAVLGMGGDMKNAFCLLQGGRAVFSQHLGDMEAEESRANWLRAYDHLQSLTGIRPSLVAYDLHPKYHSTKLGLQLTAEGHEAVQHHHAHLASCMADHGLDGEVIGLVADGTGYGTDGAIWGFEVLAGGYQDFRRIAHLTYTPLPGGEGAIRYPLMATAGLFYGYMGEDGLDRLEGALRWIRLRQTHVTMEGWEAVSAAARQAGRRQLDTARGLLSSGMNCPQVGSAGRLFDAVSALLGICRHQTYEGQAAIELGAVAGDDGAYPFLLADGQFNLALMLDELLGDMTRGADPSEMAGRFLNTVKAMLVSGARQAREETGLTAVCLSGGTFQSSYLLSSVSAALAEEGFRVFRPRHVAPGDGGIALGQAMIARRRWQQRCV